MSVEMITKDDLQEFRMQLLEDIQRVLGGFKQEEQPQWIKSKQVRVMLNVSPGTLQNLRISGDLQPKKINGCWYYSLAEIKALFKNDKK